MHFSMLSAFLISRAETSRYVGRRVPQVALRVAWVRQGGEGVGFNSVRSMAVHFVWCSLRDDGDHFAMASDCHTNDLRRAPAVPPITLGQAGAGYRKRGMCSTTS